MQKRAEHNDGQHGAGAGVSNQSWRYPQPFCTGAHNFAQRSGCLLELVCHAKAFLSSLICSLLHCFTQCAAGSEQNCFGQQRESSPVPVLLVSLHHGCPVKGWLDLVHGSCCAAVNPSLFKYMLLCCCRTCSACMPLLSFCNCSSTSPTSSKLPLSSRLAARWCTGCWIC